MSQRRNDALIPEFWSAPKGLRSLQVAVRCPAARNRRDRTAPAAQTCVNAHSRRGSGSPATRRLSGSTRLNCRFDRAAAYRMRSTSGSAICAQPVVDLPAGRARVSGHRVRQVPVQSGLYRQRRHPREQPECVGRRAIPRGSARGCRHIPRPPPASPPPPPCPGLVPNLRPVTSPRCPVAEVRHRAGAPHVLVRMSSARLSLTMLRIFSWVGRSIQAGSRSFTTMRPSSIGVAAVAAARSSRGARIRVRPQTKAPARAGFFRMAETAEAVARGWHGSPCGSRCGVCQTSCPPVSCGVSDFRGAYFGFRVEPDGSGGLPVSGFS
jgi:hypothetical protein